MLDKAGPNVFVKRVRWSFSDSKDCSIRAKWAVSCIDRLSPGYKQHTTKFEIVKLPTGTKARCRSIATSRLGKDPGALDIGRVNFTLKYPRSAFARAPLLILFFIL